ncbi:MAG: hypothetical protein ACLRWQ_12995 [Flavonifractor plautii]
MFLVLVCILVSAVAGVAGLPVSCRRLIDDYITPLLAMRQHPDVHRPAAGSAW